jgi:hypothetical protein
MSDLRRKMGIAVGVLYHGVAHPVAALTLLSGNKEAQAAAEWLLRGLQNAAIDLLQGGQQAEETEAIPESLKPFRNEEGSVMVRGFARFVDPCKLPVPDQTKEVTGKEVEDAPEA